jgi:hypothetical protein
MTRSPHGLRRANVGGNQGRDGNESSLASAACLFGLLYWMTAPFRWIRSLSVEGAIYMAMVLVALISFGLSVAGYQVQ